MSLNILPIAKKLSTNTDQAVSNTSSCEAKCVPLPFESPPNNLKPVTSVSSPGASEVKLSNIPALISSRRNSNASTISARSVCRKKVDTSPAEKNNKASKDDLPPLISDGYHCAKAVNRHVLSNVFTSGYSSEKTIDTDSTDAVLQPIPRLPKHKARNSTPKKYKKRSTSKSPSYNCNPTSVRKYRFASTSSVDGDLDSSSVSDAPVNPRDFASSDESSTPTRATSFSRRSSKTTPLRTPTNPSCTMNRLSPGSHQNGIDSKPNDIPLLKTPANKNKKPALPISAKKPASTKKPSLKESKKRSPKAITSKKSRYVLTCMVCPQPGALD